ncbi:MAG: type II secretion system F family protein [Candidatus Melainabacteria bacterium]|nr:type II secretion system F family protein [Candidatus Melainabacteria bacterium]
MRQIGTESKEINKRLQFWLSEKSASKEYSEQKEDKDESFTKRVIMPLGEQVGAWMAEKVPYSKLSAIKKLLIKAGYREKISIQIFYAIKVVIGIIVGIVSFLAISITGKDLQSTITLTFVAGIIGFILPNYILDKRATERKASIDRILPDALDLLVICTEAGMGIDQSLLRVASNLGSTKGKALSEEIILTNREMNLGQERSVCWNNLGERSNSEELKNLARIIIQSEKVGSSVADVLRNQSKFLIVKRRQKAEEAAAQMAIKMMIPMAVFIFPCIMAVTLGPPMLKLASTFGKLSQ